jgi:hypothetical protein
MPLTKLKEPEHPRPLVRVAPEDASDRDTRRRRPLRIDSGGCLRPPPAPCFSPPLSQSSLVPAVLAAGPFFPPPPGQSSPVAPFPLSLPHFLGDDYARCSSSGPGLWRCRPTSGAQVFFGPLAPPGTPTLWSSLPAVQNRALRP